MRTNKYNYRSRWPNRTVIFCHPRLHQHTQTGPDKKKTFPFPTQIPKLEMIIVLLREHRERNRDLLKIFQNNKMIRDVQRATRKGERVISKHEEKNPTIHVSINILILSFKILGVTLTMI